jgi:hypothetical protein
MKRLLYIFLFSASALSAQTAVWPGAVVTDSQLLVAANFCGSRISSSIPDTTSTTIFVVNTTVSSTCFLVNQEVQVDNEMMKITSVGFGQLTVIRGFDNSTPSTHNNNAPINNVPAAWYHNATAKEIESIETWLQTGGGGGGISVQPVTVDPNGVCTVALQPVLLYNHTSGGLWGCLNGTWTLISSGGGGSAVINNQSGTNYTLQASDNGSVVVISNVAPITLNIPTGLGSGYSALVIQGSTGVITPTAANGVSMTLVGGWSTTVGIGSSFSMLSTMADTFLGNGGLGLVSGVTMNGALGTPSSGTGTHLTGIPFATAMTGILQCSQLPAFTGDVSYSGCGATVTKVNGGGIGTNIVVLGTNSSGQLISSSGAGTGNVLAGLTLTNNLLVTGGGTTNVQTACSTCSMDASGNTALGGRGSFGGSGIASTPGFLLSGSAFTGGSGTTTTPYFLISPTGTGAATNWSTSGTQIGVNAVSGFTGDLINIQTNAVNKFRVDGSGNIYAGAGGAGVFAQTIGSNNTNTSTIIGGGASFGTAGAAVKVTGTTLSSTSGVQVGFSVQPTINQSVGTASNYVFVVSPVNTAVGSGSQYLTWYGSGGLPGVGTEVGAMTSKGITESIGIAHASLGTPANASYVWCMDCTVAACGTSGTGAWAFWNPGSSTWSCPF